MGAIYHMKTMVEPHSTEEGQSGSSEVCPHDDHEEMSQTIHPDSSSTLWGRFFTRIPSNYVWGNFKFSKSCPPEVEVQIPPIFGAFEIPTNCIENGIP